MRKGNALNPPAGGTESSATSDLSRRDVLVGATAFLIAGAMPLAATAESLNMSASRSHHTGDLKMGTITTKDGVTIFYKDWGSGQPIVFSHGWPLSSDDWDAQMMFFVNHGFRVIAHDRRGHGRSSQTADGHDMDHYADDLAALTAHLDLKDAVHVGHSTGGGEVVRYIARHGESRVAKAVLISAVPPIMVKTPANPGGLPKEVFDGFRPRSLIIVRSSTATCLRARSTDSTGRVPRFRGSHPELVAPGNDGRCEGSLRWHRRVFPD